jgi:Flp pilus assembly pilin Flp
MRCRWIRQLVANGRRFAAETEAATVTEYAVMLALIIAGMIMAISSLGQHVSDMYAAVVSAPW